MLVGMLPRLLTSEAYEDVFTLKATRGVTRMNLSASSKARLRKLYARHEQLWELMSAWAGQTPDELPLRVKGNPFFNEWQWVRIETLWIESGGKP